MAGKGRHGKASAAQLALLNVEGWTKRRVERAFDASVAAARRNGTIEPLDDGAVTMGRALARGVDMAEMTRDLWALAAVTREFRAVIERLRLDPAARGVTKHDELAELLSSMASADTGS